MPSDKSLRDQVRQLLDGLSDLELRELCIGALRRAHANKALQSDQFAMHEHLGRELLQLLAARRNVDLKGQAGNLSEVFLDALLEPWMDGIFEFVAWFVHSGFAVALIIGVGPHYYQTPIRYRLTRAGIRLLASVADHPLLPGFLQRVVQRCPGLPDAVVSLLTQGSACLDHNLTQPAISLMGVGYETAVEEVMEALIARNVLQADVRGYAAARRIAAVRQQIDNLLPATTPQERDDRFAAHAAYEFADHLRRRRNDASHTAPKYGFDDRQEAEEFLVSAGRHLPSLWRVAR